METTYCKYICNNVTMTYVVKVFFYTFPPQGNTFVSLFFIQFFIFFSSVFTKFISKSTSGINFFSKVSSQKRSLILPYELLFQKCIVIYDVNESVGQKVVVFVWVISLQTEVAIFDIIQKISLIKFFCSFYSKQSLVLAYRSKI